VRFVTLLGPGGIGKTTIAFGCWPYRSRGVWRDSILLTWKSLPIRAMYWGCRDIPGTALKSKSRLGAGRPRPIAKVLIILDNCEHVIETVALLPSNSTSKRSRSISDHQSRLLESKGEHCYWVLPSIFHQTGQSKRQMPCFDFRQCSCLYGAWRRGREASFYRRGGAVCRGNVPKADGMPLAIELAAGQVAALGLKNTISRLVSRLELLKLSHRTAVRRHRTLKATWIGATIYCPTGRGLFFGASLLSSVIQPWTARGMSQGELRVGAEKY